MEKRLKESILARIDRLGVQMLTSSEHTKRNKSRVDINNTREELIKSMENKMNTLAEKSKTENFRMMILRMNQ
jgi:hypothetical protein